MRTVVCCCTGEPGKERQRGLIGVLILTLSDDVCPELGWKTLRVSDCDVSIIVHVHRLTSKLDKKQSHDSKMMFGADTHSCRRIIKPEIAEERRQQVVHTSSQSEDGLQKAIVS